MPAHLPAKIGIILAPLICLPQFVLFIPYYDSVGKISQTIVVMFFFLLPCFGAYLYLRDVHPAARNNVYLFIGISAVIAVIIPFTISGLINSWVSAMMLCLFSPLICYLLFVAFPKKRFVKITKKLTVIITIAAVLLAFGGGWYANYAHMTPIKAMALLGWPVHGLLLASVIVLLFISAEVESLVHETAASDSTWTGIIYSMYQTQTYLHE